MMRTHTAQREFTATAPHRASRMATALVGLLAASAALAEPAGSGATSGASKIRLDEEVVASPASDTLGDFQATYALRIERRNVPCNLDGNWGTYTQQLSGRYEVTRRGDRIMIRQSGSMPFPVGSGSMDVMKIDERWFLDNMRLHSGLDDGEFVQDPQPCEILPVLPPFTTDLEWRWRGDHFLTKQEGMTLRESSGALIETFVEPDGMTRRIVTRRPPAEQKQTMFGSYVLQSIESHDVATEKLQSIRSGRLYTFPDGSTLLAPLFEMAVTRRTGSLAGSIVCRRYEMPIPMTQDATEARSQIEAQVRDRGSSGLKEEVALDLLSLRDAVAGDPVSPAEHAALVFAVRTDGDPVSRLVNSNPDANGVATALLEFNPATEEWAPAAGTTQ